MRAAIALAVVAVVLLAPLSSARAQTGLLAQLHVVAADPVDRPTGPDDSATPRSIVIEPSVELLGGSPLDELLPAQLELITTTSDGAVHRTTRLLTALTPPTDLGAALTRATGQAPGMRVTEMLAPDVVSAVARAYLLDPQLDLIAASPGLQLLHPLATSVSNGGHIAADPARLACPGSCDAHFLLGDTVTLTATPDPGFAFGGWTGSCSAFGLTQTCELVISAAVEAGAVFSAHVQPVPLSVSVVGPAGSRVVSSNYDLIDCPGQCEASFLPGQQVVLTATPGKDGQFVGWSETCASLVSTTCAITITVPTAVEARFNPVIQTVDNDLTLEVELQGAAPGERVRSSPPGIDCPGDCLAEFPPGTLVKLVAHTAKAGRHVSAWSVPCPGGHSCSVELRASRTVLVTFAGGPLEVPPPSEPEPTITKLDPPGCPTSRTCLPTAYELIASLPSWPLLLVSVLVLLLVAVPSTMFDSTLEAHYDALDRRYLRVARWLGFDIADEWWMRSTPRRAATTMGACALVVALIYRWAGDPPGAGFAGELAALFAAAVAFVVVTLAREWPEAQRAEHLGVEGRIRAKAPTIVIAIVCAVVSANLHLDPGYTFGIVAGFTSSQLLRDRQGRVTGGVDGDSTAVGAIAVLLLTVGAWLVWWIAKDHGITDNPTAAKVFLSHLLVFTVTAGFSQVAFSYLPIRYFDGSLVIRWDYYRWRYLQLIALLVACLVFASSRDDYVADRMFDEPGPAVVALVVALAFAGISYGLWRFFAFLDDQPAEDEAAKHPTVEDVAISGH